MADKRIDHLAGEVGADDIAEFLRLAAAGDETMLPALRLLLQDPANVAVLGGDLAKTVERELIHQAAGGNRVTREALMRKLDMLRAELAGPDPTPLERLLVDRVLIGWLALHEAEIHFSRGEGLTIAQSDYLQRRIDRLHRRYLASIRTLATVRRLAVPVFRVKLAVEPGRNGKGRTPVLNALEERFSLPPAGGLDV